MPDYTAPVRDMLFALNNIADLSAVAKFDRYSHADPETVAGILEENGRFLTEVVAPTNQSGDEIGATLTADGEVVTPPGFKEAYQAYVDAGWAAVPFDPDYGGGGFPWIVGVAMQEMLTSANMAFSMCPLLTQGALDALDTYGDEEQKEKFLPKMISGEWTGTMNLTEPDAGSDVGALRTKAVKQDDGTYLIGGQKIFISFGEHDMAGNIIHLVLARTPDAPPGTKGISCFIVPKFMVGDDGSLGEKNDVKCVSIEHKMGIKASPTCALAFGDDSDGAVGYLIGEENQGMRYMFKMMNNARLSVGLEGMALAERSYQQSLEFAQERRQGRAIGAPKGEQSPIIEHADVRRMLLTMRSYIEAMRNLIYVNAEQISIATASDDEDDRTKAAELVELLIPLSKGWGTDMGVRVTGIGVQIHGGMGFIEETGVAQHYRDARITTIYEGTNGIQAMDLVGRKLPMRGGAVVSDLFDMIAETVADVRGAGDEFAATADAIDDALAAAREATDWLINNGLANPVDALAGATPYLRLMSLAAAGWLMGRQALVASSLNAGGDDPYYAAKVTTAKFFCEQLLGEARAQLRAVTAGAGPLFEIAPEHLGV